MPQTIVSFGGGGADGGVPPEGLPEPPDRSVRVLSLVKIISDFSVIVPPWGATYVLLVKLNPTTLGTPEWRPEGWPDVPAQPMTMLANGIAPGTLGGVVVFGLESPVLTSGTLGSFGTGFLYSLWMAGTRPAAAVLAAQAHAVGGLGATAVSVTVPTVRNGLVIATHGSHVNNHTVTPTTPPEFTYTLAPTAPSNNFITRYQPPGAGTVTIAQTTPQSRRQSVSAVSFSPST